MLNLQPDTARKIRAIIFYSSSCVAFTALSVYLLKELSALLLPILIGALLAYIFKPLLATTRIPWLPNSVRVLLLLALFGSGTIIGVNKIKSSIPDEQNQLVLQIRMNYKLHEKYISLMGVNEKTGKGNVFYNLVKDEVNPLMAKLYGILNLDREQRRKFRRYYRSQTKENPIPKKYYEYYKTNLRRANIELKQLEAAQKKEAMRAIASTDTKEQKESLLLGILDTLSTWLLTPFVFIFLLFDKGQVMRFFIRLVPNKFFELSLVIVEEVDQAIGNYLRGTILECSLVGLTIGLGLAAVGIDISVALMIGAVAGLANAIPFLGPVIGLVVGLSYGLIVEEITPFIPFITLDNLFVGIFLCVLLAQLLDNTIFQPIVLGSAVNLHPLVVIIGVMGGSALFGFAGMLFAIPAIVVFKVVLSTLVTEMKAYRII